MLMLTSCTNPYIFTKKEIETLEGFIDYSFFDDISRLNKIIETIYSLRDTAAVMVMSFFKKEGYDEVTLDDADLIMIWLRNNTEVFNR